jgi:type I restriction enzyme S subunit
MAPTVLTHALQGLGDRIQLDQVAEVRLGRQRSPKNHFGPNMRPYLRAANVTWNGLSLGDVKSMHFSPSEVETYELRVGDVLLAEASGSADEVGKPAVWHGEIQGCCFQNTLIRVRSNGPLPEFLYLVFLREALTGKFAQAAPGVGIHHLGASRLARWKIPVPPLDEQRRIVAEIERQLSISDATAAEIDRALRRSAALRRSILEQAFSGKLVPQDPSDEPASVLLERIAAERVAKQPTRQKRAAARA